jgi:hypothetical protein
VEQIVGEHLVGVIPMLLAGERPGLRDVEGILKMAEETEFYEEGRVESRFDDGSVVYTPGPLKDNSIAQAVLEGLLVSQLTIEGSPPLWQRLDPGTYYFHLDFAPGPTLGGKEGRWVGRIIRTRPPGGLECVVPIVEVKQIFTSGIHDREQHNKPSVVIHGQDPGLGGFGAKQGWAEYQVEWIQVGVGCVKTIVCAPDT